LLNFLTMSPVYDATIYLNQAEMSLQAEARQSAFNSGSLIS
jgi:hypothetical protein